MCGSVLAPITYAPGIGNYNTPSSLSQNGIPNEGFSLVGHGDCGALSRLLEVEQVQQHLTQNMYGFNTPSHQANKVAGNFEIKRITQAHIMTVDIKTIDWLDLTVPTPTIVQEYGNYSRTLFKFYFLGVLFIYLLQPRGIYSTEVPNQ